MSYKKEGYEYMGSEILKDFCAIGIFLEPNMDQHYTTKITIFKNKITEVISTEVNVVILTNVINPERHKKGAIEIIQTMIEHSMFQQWVNPEFLSPVVDYLQFYIEAKCESVIKAKSLYERAKKLTGEGDEIKGEDGANIG